MIVLGAMIAVWGGLVLFFSRPLHASWKGMLADMRRAGVANTLLGTKFLASEGGLRAMRIAGGAALAAGVGLVLAGLVRLAVG